MNQEQYAAEIYDWAAELVDAIERKDLEHADRSLNTITEMCEKLLQMIEAIG